MKNLNRPPWLAALPASYRAALEETLFVFIGNGALCRPWAENLANLGMSRCLFIDPKNYKPESIFTQCDQDEVGLSKAKRLAHRLVQWGVQATALQLPFDAVQPGWFEAGTAFLISTDNRQPEIQVNRLASSLGGIVIKANVEPFYLLASISCLDYSGPTLSVCGECGMTRQEYLEQQHPRSCDGAEGRPTNSPRALCQLAGAAAALATAQIVGAPELEGKKWLGRQWQLSLVNGEASWSTLPPNPACRYDHQPRWPQLRWLSKGPADLSLRSLAESVGLTQGPHVAVRFSGQVADTVRCQDCGRPVPMLRWLQDLFEPVAPCPCGGLLAAVAFWTHDLLPAAKLADVWDASLARWGVPGRAVLALEAAGRQPVSFAIGFDPSPSGKE